MIDFSDQVGASVGVVSSRGEHFKQSSGVAVSKAKPTKRPSPLSIRLSVEEKADLRVRAGDMAVSAYAKSLLFAANAKAIRRSPRNPLLDHRMLGQILAQLGRNEIAPHLSTIAQAARSGSLPLDEVTYAQIEECCYDIALMRSKLMAALGNRGVS